MSRDTRKASIRNIADVPWKEFPDHFGGALSKPLVNPENAPTKYLDYRISIYQPMAYVKLHSHKVQEQIFHVLDGEALIDLDGERRLVRKHDVIHLPPGAEHSIQNTGLSDLVFIVVTIPPTDD
jgi:mannose-6-phosphate isomerase-like protein (cupin superfamily)